MKKLFFLLLGLIVFLSNSVYSLTVQSYNLNISVTPSEVQPGQTFTLQINYAISAKKDFYDFLTYGKGIFFRVYVGGNVYRTGISGCVTSPSDQKCDIPYKFDGSLLSGTTTISLTAPTSPGTYDIKVEMVINRANYLDKYVTESHTNLIVSSVVAVQPTTIENKTEQPPSSVYGTCQFSNFMVWTTPSLIVEGQPFDIHISFSYTCSKTNPYGPFLKIRIRDSTYKIIKEWRVGDQGVTTDLSKNYYFSPSGGSKEVVISGVTLTSGMYYITIEGVYSNQNSFDSPIFSEYRAYTLYVENLSQTTVPSEQLPPTVTMGTCSGSPILVMTAWSKDDKILASPTVQVGEKVYAIIKLRNPYSTCRYEGTISVQIRKDQLGLDPIVQSYSNKTIINPNQDILIKVEFVPTTAGQYHYDVYWNNFKYGSKDVQVRYGSISCSSLDPTGCYAGPDLNVYSSTQEIQEKVSETIQVTNWWFEQAGTNVTQLVEGEPALGCVSLVSSIDTTATVTVQIKAFSGVQQVPVVGDLPPDPVKAESTQQIVFTANQPVTVCTKFIPVQTSAIHNEMYYIAVLVGGKEIGIFPKSKNGATLIPKTSGLNPFIVGTDKINNVVIVDHGWFDEEGNKVENMVPAGTYLVKAELSNTGGFISNVTVKIKVRADRDFWFDSDVDSCTQIVTVPPNKVVPVQCSFSLGDGRYHYEIYINDNKVVPRGPTLHVGFVGFIEKYVSPVIKTVGIPGLIILFILFITGPYWIPFIINVIQAWLKLFEFIRRK